MSHSGPRRILLAALAAALLGALVPQSAAAAASVCARSEPTGMKFERKRGLRYGRLSWDGNKPGATYRIFRNGVVVGQTKKSSMPVRVKAGRRYAFAVRMVRHSGLVANCVGILRQRVAWFPPTRTRKPLVRKMGEAAVRLRWHQPRPGDGPVTGYRLYRDGSLHRKVRRRSARLRLPSGGTHKIEVAAIDTRGGVGPRSRAVYVETGHRPPGPPVNLSTAGVTDTQLTLSWGASSGGSARIVGYRVFRNGVPLRQVGALSTVVGGLFPFTDYSFTAAAVDSRGYVGPAAIPAQVKTAMPPPSNGKLHAFMLASTDASFEALQTSYQQIGTVYPTYFQCPKNSSTVAGSDDPLVTNWAKLRRIRLMPRFNCQHAGTLHYILTDFMAREASLVQLTDIVRQNGYDGLNLDFEGGYEGDRDAFTSYVAKLGRRLHAMGKKLSLEVSAKYDGFSTSRNRFYDYPALNEFSDYVFVMNWGYHWSASDPGSPDPLPQVRAAADYAASMPHKGRFVLGSPLYGMDWAAGGGPSRPATALHHSEIMQLIARYGGRPVLDSGAYTWHYRYTDPGGIGHDVWFGDRTTLAARMQVAKDRGLGFGVWRLGQEDPGIWDLPLMAPNFWPK